MQRRCFKPSFPFVRHASLPGWRTQTSTKDIRTREQREIDRKARQIDKLPLAVPLPTFPTPTEKMALADFMFQPPVYDSQWDSPENLYPTAPHRFILEYRVLSQKNKESEGMLESNPLVDHTRMLRYLHKHNIVPTFASSLPFRVFSQISFGSYFVQAGNFIPLKDCEKLTLDRIQLYRSTSHASISTVPSTPDYYALYILCPDYPIRQGPGKNIRGFLLHHLVVNLQSLDLQTTDKNTHPPVGTELIPFCPPLPTEGGGSIRLLCVLFPQYQKLQFSEKERKDFQDISFKDRFPYRLHAQNGDGSSVLARVESVVSPQPEAITFFTTSWDATAESTRLNLGEKNHQKRIYIPKDLSQILRERIQNRKSVLSVHGKGGPILSGHTARPIRRGIPV